MELIFTSYRDALRMQACLLKANIKGNFIESENKYFIELSNKQFAGYVEAIITFIIQGKRDELLDQILHHRFYFENEDERQQIINIVASMCSGQREELTALTKKVDEYEVVKECVQSAIQEQQTILFDSLLTFRLKRYEEALMNYLLVAIDEYKMEQEYQVFLQTLRDFLQGRRSKKKVIHLSIDHEIKFFDEHFQLITKDKVTSWIDRRLLSNHPIYVDSSIIAPLLSVAPETIHLYTNEEDGPLVRTLKNIFEERLLICSPSTLKI